MTTHRHEAYRKIQPGTLWPTMGRKRSTTQRYTLRMVPVADIVRNLSSSVDLGYGDGDGVVRRIVNSKIWDESTWTLIDYFLDDTAFAIPICIVVNENDEWEMGNGHHRLVAEILTLAHEEIPVLFSLNGDYMHTWITSASDEERGAPRRGERTDAPGATIPDLWAADTDTELANLIRASL